MPDLFGTKRSNWLSVEDGTAYGYRGADYLFGAGGDTTLRGGRGDDVLVGGPGQVPMSGGRGDDTFAFNSSIADGSLDRIKDFKSGHDTIAIGDDWNDWYHRQPLAADQFVVGTTALDANDRVIYDDTCGRVYFDHDGFGGDDAVLIAKIKGAPTLDHGDFLIG